MTSNADRPGSGDFTDNKSALAVDLFDTSVILPRGHGRPPYRPMAKTRRLVAEMHTHGWSQPMVAAAFNLTIPTLVRHYGTEIESRAARLAPLKSKGE